MRATVTMAHRVVITVAWGAVLALVGMYVASAWSIFGYVQSYTLPRRVSALNVVPSFPSRFDLTGLECLFVWLGLLGMWLAGALFMLGGRSEAARAPISASSQDATARAALPGTATTSGS
jgi:hypothetical protein